MSRIRSIKPEFWTDEKVVSMSYAARLAFIGLWNFADDEGRGEYSPVRLKMQILPADNADMSALLGEIRRQSLIEVYTVDGKEYFQINGFIKHQKIDKRRLSRLPPAPTCADPRRLSPTDREGKGREDSEPNGSGGAAAVTEPPPVELPEEPLDDRTWLFRVGLGWLAEMTGRKEPALRPVVGRWLSRTGDDASAIRVLITRCRGSPVADPLAVIEAALKPRPPNGKRPAHDVFEAALAAEVAGLGNGSGEWPSGAAAGFRSDERTIDLAEGAYRRTDPLDLARERH